MVNIKIRLIIFFAANNGEALDSKQKKKKRLGADCGSDHELLMAKFSLKLKKVWKTTRPFRYGLNQISYDYTEEVKNRFKGLNMMKRVPEERETELGDIVQDRVINIILQKNKYKKAKFSSEEALQCTEKKGELEGKGEKQQ